MNLRHAVRTCLFAALLGAQATATAEVALTNYSATRLLKIMPIGDSITDDCSLNGAWRLYLQSMLESNGYPFTFVGRQISSPSGSFTKTKHEGYCGTVIAPPGVFAVHNYNTTDAYLLKIVADALAITANRPDLVLILIGANDIGRGRDPYQVATNDMPKLLDLIWSNVPNANIIISKITSLQNANLGSYGAYATNVLIYNAELQTMVNQRRALGANLFLADMFSAVDYNTMFMADHVHPSALGLNAMAKEWLARIQAITVRSNRFTSTFIHGGDSWRYFDTGEDLGTNWTQLNYDDTAWNRGYGRFGYGEPTIETVLNFGGDSANKFTTAYFRHPFVVPWNLQVTNLNFRLTRAHGAAVWLNGQEVFRTNLPSGPIAYTNLATIPMLTYPAQVYYPTNIAVTNSLKGTNLVAVEIHQSSLTNATLGFDLELIGSGNLISPPALGLSQMGGSFVLSWPVTNADQFTLYSTTNLQIPEAWSSAAGSLSTNGDQIVVTQSPDANAKFFRLQRQ